MSHSFMKSKYDINSRKLVTQSFKEILKVIEGLGGDIDVDKSSNVLGFTYKVYNKRGELVLKKNIFDFKKLLRLIESYTPVGINLDRSRKLGSVYSVVFNNDISFLIEENRDESQGSQEEENCSNRTAEVPEEPDQENQTETGNEPGTSDLGSVIQEHSAGLDAEVGIVTESETVLEEPNWVALSSPTYGKKNLVSLAEKHGITLNPKDKYQDLVIEFKDKFENQD